MIPASFFSIIQPKFVAALMMLACINFVSIGGTSRVPVIISKFPSFAGVFFIGAAYKNDVNIVKIIVNNAILNNFIFIIMTSTNFFIILYIMAQAEYISF